MPDVTPSLVLSGPVAPSVTITAPNTPWLQFFAPTQVPFPIGGGGGVTSLNSLTGALALAAGENVTITISGSTIFIGAASSSGVASISGYITTGQADLRYYPLGSNPSGYLTSAALSGLVNSGDLTRYYLASNPSGFITTGQTGQFASAFALYQTGVQLGQTIFNTGAAAVQYTNTVGAVLSGTIAATGAASISYSTAISGYLYNLINANSGRVISLNGLSGILNLTGAGSTYVTIDGQNLVISGAAAPVNLSGYITTGQADLRYYPLLSNPSGYITGINTGDFVTRQETGQFASANALYLTGSYLYGLINASSAGVSSLNGLSGALTLLGTGNVSVSTNGQTLIVSGDTGAYAQFATVTNLFLTGFSLYQTLTGLSGQFATDYATKAQLTQSGVVLGAQIVATGTSAVVHANGVGSGLSGVIAQTGSNLYNVITGLSGQSVFDYATKVQLTQTGVTLGQTIINSGNAAVIHANGVGSGLSGALSATGSNLYNLITGSSGQYTTDFATKIQLTLTGVQLGATINATGTAAIVHANGIGSGLSGVIAQTGSALYALITGNSGQGVTDYATKTQLTLTGVQLGATIVNTGNSAVIHANGIGSGLSGNLAATGSTLDNKINSLSGYSNAVFATKITVDLLSGALATTGSNLYVLITGLSGQGVLDYATKVQLTNTGVALGATIVSTGNAAVIHANGVGSGLSGVLTQTGVLLGATIIATGNAAISHANGIGSIISGNLTATGSYLYVTTTGLSGTFVTQIALTGSQAWNAANNNGINLSGALTQSGIALMLRDTTISGILQGYIDAIAAGTGSVLNNVVFTTGNQFIQGTKYFAGNTYIDNLYVTGTRTIVNTQEFDVAANFITLNATGGARDAGFFISTGFTGVNATGGILGFDVPSNRWVFGIGNADQDLNGLPLIASIADITAASGGLEQRIFLTGAAAVAFATSLNLATSGALATRLIDTGNALYTQLYNTGQLLFNRDVTISGILQIGIDATGNALYTQLAGTGAKITSLSGFAVAFSGALQTQINTTNTNLTLTGQQAYNWYTGLSGALAQTGVNLYTQLYNTGQLILSASGGIETRIIATGNAAVAHANGIGSIISGDLTNTGVALINLNRVTSGVLQTGIDSTGNALYTQLAGTGLKITSLSGFVNTLSGALDLRLTLTGQTLVNQIAGLSGVVNTLYGTNIVYTTGAQTVNGSKRFADKTLIGNLTTGSFGVGSTDSLNYAGIEVRNGNFVKHTTFGFDGVWDNIIRYGAAGDPYGANSGRFHSMDATITAGTSNAIRFNLFTGGAVGGQRTVMTLIDFGNVGIGTTAPTNYGTASPNLEINGTAGGILTLSYNGSRRGYLLGDSAGPSLNSVGATPWTFLTNGSERMRIDADGDVGIGTNNPTYRLHVQNGSAEILHNANNPQLRVVDTSVVSKLQSVTVGGTLGVVGTESNHDFNIITNNTSRITALTDGKIGIGITNPGVLFQISGADQRMNITSATAGITIGQWDGITNRFEGNGKPLFFTSYGGGLMFGQDGSSQMVLTGGYLGVGTASPSNPLHVVGNGAVGALRLDNQGAGAQYYASFTVGATAIGRMYRSDGTNAFRIDAFDSIVLGANQNGGSAGFVHITGGNLRVDGSYLSGTQNLADVLYPRSNPSGYITSAQFISSGEQNYDLTLTAGTNEYSVTFPSPFAGVPRIFLQQQLLTDTYIYGFAAKDVTTGGFKIVTSDTVAADIKVSVLAKLITGYNIMTTGSFVIVVNSGAGGAGGPQNAFALGGSPSYSLGTGIYRYTWSGASQETGVMPNVVTSSGATIYIKNKGLSNFLLNGNIDGNGNYTMGPKESVSLWSDANVWNLV